MKPIFARSSPASSARRPTARRRAQDARPHRRPRALRVGRLRRCAGGAEPAALVGSSGRASRAPSSSTRAFCLLALGRSADAEQAIEAVVAAEPSYQPGDERRVAAHPLGLHRRSAAGCCRRSSSRSTRRRRRRSIARNSPRRADGFTQVLTALADPDVAAEASAAAARRTCGRSPAASRSSRPKASAPPRRRRPVAARRRGACPPPAPADASASTPAERTASSRPPSSTRRCRRFRARSSSRATAGWNCVIDEFGAVESAAMTGSVTPAYDQMVIAATKELALQAGDAERRAGEVPQDGADHHQADVVARIPETRTIVAGDSRSQLRRGG